MLKKYTENPHAYHFKNANGEDCTVGLYPWCYCSRLRRGELIPEGKWMICPKCKQPDKEKLTLCPICQRLWRGPRPDFPFQLECPPCSGEVEEGKVVPVGFNYINGT